MSSQADNTIQFSFDSPNSVSEAQLQEAVTNPANPDHAETKVVTPAPVEAKVETTPEEVKPAEPSVPAVTPELKTHKITVQGQEIEVTEADLLAGHMRHRDYTQKTQQLAEQQRQWDSERAELRGTLQALDQFLNDKAALTAFVQKQHGVDPTGQAAQPPQIDPNRPLTAQDVAKIAAYNAEQIRLSMAAEFEGKLRAQAEDSRANAQAVESNIQRKELASEIDTHVSSLLAKHPLLSKFEDISEDLMGDAAKRTPRGSSLEYVKEQLTAAAERRIAVIQSIATEEKKSAAVQAAKLKNGSPEPPGGKAVPAPAGKKLTLNTSDQKAFREAALVDLQAFVDANT